MPTPSGDVSESGLPLVVAPSRPAVGVILVRLMGELDMHTVPRLDRVLTTATDAVATEMERPHGRSGPPRGRIVCDLDGLDFLSLSGLRALLAAARRAEALGLDVALIAARRPARRVLELSGLDRCFDIVDAFARAPSEEATRPAAA